MKFTIALFALFAAANATVITTGGLLASPYAAVIPTSRTSRSDWIQPGLAYNIPAVARYQSITPGFTTLHQTSVPVVAQAPVLAAPAVAAAPLIGTTGLIGGAYTAGLAGPIYVKK